MDTLFSWFSSKIQDVYGIKPETEPGVILRRLGASEKLLGLFASLNDCEINLKQSPDGPVPDLEQREKKRKRNTGQFYTPESLAARLVKMAKPVGSGDLLDPACGDGSFMIAMAGLLRSNGVICIGIAERSSGPGQGFLRQLHGYDIDLQALFVCLTRLICAFPGCGWPELEQRDFLLDPPQQKFALIIGNPPYRVNLDVAFKQKLADIYKTGEGEKDLYTFFLEGSLLALKPAGQIIMLTSHTYLVNHQCEKIRNYIFTGYCVESLLMLPGRFFAAAPGVLPVVIVAENSVPEPLHQVRVATDYSESEGWQREYLADAASFLSCSGLRQAIVPVALKKVFAVMDNCGAKLGENCRVGVGIQESLQRNGPVSRHVSNESLTPRHRPVLRGRELSPFKINWEGKYIDYGPHLAYAGCEKTFAGPKILYQNIRNEKLKMRLVAAFDDGCYFPKNSLSYVVANSDQYPPMFMLGLINSVLVNAWFSGHFHSFHVTVTQVRQIPLPPVNSCLFMRIAELTLQLMNFDAGSSGHVEAYSLLNEAVCECYLGAGYHESLISQCNNFLEQAASL